MRNRFFLAVFSTLFIFLALLNPAYGGEKPDEVNYIPVEETKKPLGYENDQCQENCQEYKNVKWVTPEYPVKAHIHQVEGFVVLKYTITKTGKVTDIEVIAEVPEGYKLAKASIKALEKFKYSPRLVDGEPQEVRGVVVKIDFTLE